MHIFVGETDCLKRLSSVMKLPFFFSLSQNLRRMPFVLWSLVISCTRQSLPATEQPGFSECFVVHVETFDLYTLQEIASGCIYSPVYCDLFTE